VSVYGNAGGPPLTRLADFDAYPGFGGSVRVAVIDQLFREQDPETDSDDYFGIGLITGAGPTGGPHVKMHSRSLAVLDEFFAYGDTFFGGIFVAAGGSRAVGSGGDVD
jgi:hypothetical protein